MPIKTDEQINATATVTVTVAAITKSQFKYSNHYQSRKTVSVCFCRIFWQDTLVLIAIFAIAVVVVVGFVFFFDFV